MSNPSRDYSEAEWLTEHLSAEDKALIVRIQDLAERAHQSNSEIMKRACSTLIIVNVERLAKQLKVSNDVANVLACFEVEV